jgi:hypothetical protein
MENKNFQKDFKKIYKLLKSRTPMAYLRFSDGELFHLQGKRLILGNNIIQVGDKHQPGGYKQNDHKDFDPEKHQLQQKLLMDSFLFEKRNYFKGLSCRCCVGEKNFKWQLDILRGQNEEYLTWSNLFVNTNYPLFVKFFIPLFSEFEKIVVICNKDCDLSDLPFKNKIIKDFRIGPNALVNDHGLASEVHAWALENHVENTLFLLCASSISNLVGHRLYADERTAQNFFIDIGSTLNPYLGMGTDREYLDIFWNNGPGVLKQCIW